MQHKNILKWALVLGIIIVLNLFFYFAVKLIYKTPEWDDFCPVEQVNIQPRTQEECIELGGSWTEEIPIEKTGMITADVDVSYPSPESISGYCDKNYTCRKEFKITNNLYRRNLFVALVALGLLSLVLGFALKANEVVSLGLAYGGVLSFVVASVQYWSAMDDYWRVIILGLALATLIYLGSKKFKV